MILSEDGTLLHVKMPVAFGTHILKYPLHFRLL